MAKERAQKKSFQDSLEDIKERMKEKRNKRLASATTSSRGRNRNVNKSSGANSTHAILKGVQLNNKTLAVALQAEKERVRQANAVILQLKREQQALFLHLLLLKKKLKEREALAASSVLQTKTPHQYNEPQCSITSTRRKCTGQDLEEQPLCKGPIISADPNTPENTEQSECDQQFILPSTVGTRRRHTEKINTRRSEHVQKWQSFCEDATIPEIDTSVLGPICSNDKSLKLPQQRSEPGPADATDPENFQHSTPEPVPRKKSNRKKAQQQQPQPRTKTEPAAQKAERGRKVERSQLRKPWEKSKPRARSKSRDRSATRSKKAPPLEGNKLNTSLGFNDTFDFDCEETTHVTPFKAKVEDSQPTTPITEQSPQREQAVGEELTSGSKKNESCLSPSSSESDDSLYVPHKTAQTQMSSGQTSRVIITRRGRPSKVVGQKKNVTQEQANTVFGKEHSDPKVLQLEKQEPHLHQWPDSNSPNPTGMEEECQEESHKDGLDEDSLPLVSPLVEAEMMRIDDVLSNFRDASSDAPPLLTHQTPKRIKTCQKRGLGVRTAGRGLSLCDVTNLSPAAYRRFTSDARCSTPAPARKRRCTMAVNYKEPSLGAKLRRGDRFTDLQFLSSPIFKQKSDSRSVSKPRKSVSSQKQTLHKYNESFVGCH